MITWDSTATKGEMLEMLQLIYEAKGTEFQIEYWVECLRLNTGDEYISDLIFWPDEYFWKTIDKELSAEEILDEALGPRSSGELSNLAFKRTPDGAA